MQRSFLSFVTAATATCLRACFQLDFCLQAIVFITNQPLTQ
jgi:hypothetical protein